MNQQNKTERWEEIKKEYSQSGLFDLACNCKKELDNDVYKMIEEAKAEARERCLEEVRETVINYFTGSGELLFPYVGVGADTEEEERQSATDILDPLLEELSALTTAEERIKELK